ncbi:hypothetical protein ABK040_006333 [Willaertia magna]
MSKANNNNNDNIKIVQFEEKHITEGAKLACRAFIDDPGFNYIFQAYENDKTGKEEIFTWFWERYLWLSVAFNEHTFIAIDKDKEDKIVGMICPLYPTDPKPTLWTNLRAGIALFPFKAGYQAFTRSQHSIKVIGELQNKFIWNEWKENETAKIEHVAVDPDYQGKGIGSKIVNYTIDKIKEKKCNWNIFLGTQKDRNVTFYRKLGFEVVAQALIEPELKEKSPPVYLLKFKK